MAYNALNNLIDAYINANGVQAITGSILNGILKQMVSELGDGYHLMGVAVPSTQPDPVDYSMAYFAATAGTYTYFDGIVLSPGEAAVIISAGNGTWEKRTFFVAPTKTSDLDNDSGFITNAVTDLVNYYTKTEVDTNLENYPTLAALATALANYYTKTEIDGQKAETDAALADRYTKSETDTKFADYYRKSETYDKDEVDSIVAALSRQEYIVAWDGLAEPDIDAIPAGVTVTYNATPYTGTLAASAYTVNKIYMVWNGTAYDMYGTSQDGGYSWVPMGTTTVDLSQYATKVEVSQLEAKVDDKLDGPAEENPDFLRVYTDEDGNILWGIRPDGDIYFGAGVPRQIKRQVSDLIKTKVDKVDGESLINSDFAAAQSVIPAQEWLDVKTDGEGRILEGITPNGEKYVSGLRIGGIKQNTSNAEEWMSVVTDDNGKILGGRKKDGVLKECVGIESDTMKAKIISTENLLLKGESLENLVDGLARQYPTLLDAVNEKKTGIIQVGENVVVGLKKLEGNFSPLDIESAYRSTLPNPLFPFIKKVELQRLYDDAPTPNKLYVCSHSQTHIFYSIAPTDPRRTAQSGYYSSYAANYFYYASKDTPSEIHKVVLPETFGGKSMTRRISFVFELSNGDCLVEMDNGDVFESSYRHYCIYKVRGVFEDRAITQNDITLSLSFDYGFAKISSFDNIVEYKAGHIVLAPYSGGRSGKVYISKDYGDSWDLIFCGNPDNTEYIKPKAEHFGEDDAVGIYPTPDLLNPEGAIDWNGTLNGNVHIHGIAYDRWYDRIWIVTGDGGYGQLHNVTGIWWTDDEGYTWKRIGGYMEIGTQLIGIIPMEHCVLFPTDGPGDGYWRWSRNGKDTIIEIEECYNFYGYSSSLLVAGGRSIKAGNGFYLTTFAPENDYTNKGGVIATFNGFSFQKIYEDNFSEGTFDTQEVGWACDICDNGRYLILGAYQGGYIKLIY